MANIIKVKNYARPSAGDHAATLVKITDKGVNLTKYGPRDQYEFQFRIDDEEETTGADLHVSTKINKECGKKSKFREYQHVLRPDLQPVDGVWNVDDLLGASCRIRVIHEDKDDGRKFANIAEHGIFSAAPDTSFPPATTSPATSAGNLAEITQRREVLRSSVPVAAAANTSGSELHENIVRARKPKQMELTTGANSEPSAPEITT